MREKPSATRKWSRRVGKMLYIFPTLDSLTTARSDIVNEYRLRSREEVAADSEKPDGQTGHDQQIREARKTAQDHRALIRDDELSHRIQRQQRSETLGHHLGRVCNRRENHDHHQEQVD